MRSTPRYSIIIPVYKAASNLPRLMQCLQSQTDPNFEALFVNDCSPDDSAAIITAYAQTDSRIRLFNQPRNMRQAAARNRGLDEAHGEFILFVDADDGFAPNYLERMHEAITSADADMAICNPLFVYPDRSEVVDSFAKTPGISQKIFSRDELLRYACFHWGISDFFYRIEPWGKLIRHSLLAHYKLRFKGTFSEDVGFSVSLACISSISIAISDPLYFYNKCDESDLTRQAINYTKHFHEHHIHIKDFMEKVLPPQKASYFFSLFFMHSYFPGIVSFIAYAKDTKEANTITEIVKDIAPKIINEIDITLHDFSITNGQLIYFKEKYKSMNIENIFLMFCEKHKKNIHNISLYRNSE
ncbi:glycosyltransferase [Desulfovibrio sp. OttesenSCG-928-I05]|nr:glycosyltransferase [Desulfovibrio sp. OttesenSCG-928-I05]